MDINFLKTVNIKSAQYVKAFPFPENSTVKLVFEGKENQATFISATEDDPLYKELMKKVDAGEVTIEPADEPADRE